MEYTLEEEEIIRQQQAQQGMPPIYQTPPPSKDQELMEGLLNFKIQTIEPLKHSWRGDLEIEPGVWKNRPGFAMMNDKGICWCAGQLERFLTSTFSMSNLDENLMNWNMRILGKTVWNGVSMLYLEWDLRKQNIPTVAHSIVQTCCAVLLMARGDGTRRFLSTTHQINELRSANLSPEQQPQQKKGVFGIFKSKPPPPQPPTIPENYGT